MLSTADIRVLALCLTLELEENGSWRVRDTPGQILTGPPKVEETEGAVVEGTEKEVGLEAVALEKLSLEEGEKEIDPVASTSGATVEGEEGEGQNEEVVEEEDDSDDFEVVDHEENQEDDDDDEDEEDDEGSDADSDDSHDSSSSWITPENLIEHKVKDLGLFTPPPIEGEGGAVKPPKTIMKAAVLTGDFAMQNVALQMGLNVLGSGGKRVREVRTWVLRCHACYK